MIKQKGNTAIIATIVGIIIIGAIIAIVRNNSKAEELENPVINSEQTEETNETTEENEISIDTNVNIKTSVSTAKQVTVTYTSQGFSPATVTINEGDTVVFKNNSNNSFWPASDDHPTHRIYSEFDPKKPIIPGQTYSFTFKKAGTWEYHDHLRATQTGTIIVK